MHHNYQAHPLEPGITRSEPTAATSEAQVPRACAPQQEKPLQ